MEQRYKVIISNKYLYKEIELAQGAQRLVLGTNVECDVRLHKGQFFESVALIFEKDRYGWSVTCSENLYLTEGNAGKLFNRRLSHGDSLQLKYQQSDNLVFGLDFLIDFDDGKRKYERAVDVSGRNSISIGSGTRNDIVLGSSYATGESISLIREYEDYILRVHQTQYGVYHNGIKVWDNHIIKNGDFLSVADFFFYIKDGMLWTEIRSDLQIQSLPCKDFRTRSNYPVFHRNTRIKTVSAKDKIQILDPPALPKKPKENVLLRMLPSVGMLLAAGMMALNGGSMVLFSLFSAFIAILTAVLTYFEGKKDFREELENRQTTYNGYVANKRAEIQQIREQERSELEQQYIGLGREKARFEVFSANLFDRTPEDEDFLHVRLGTGSVTATREIEYKKQEKLEVEDPLQMIPEQLSQEFKMIANAPVICDFKEINALGVYGPENLRFETMKNMVVDIVARQFYSDVRLFFVAEQHHKDRIYWMRMLPYVQDDLSGLRGIVCNDESKNQVFEYLYKELTLREERGNYDRRIIVFFYDEYGFRNHPISKFVNKAKSLGVTLVFFGEKKENIPMGCGYLVELRDSQNAVLFNTEDNNKSLYFTYPAISDAEMKKIVDVLVPVQTEEISLENSLTKNISLFELLNIIAVDDLNLDSRWSQSAVFKSMAAPLGVSKTGVVYLDLHDKAHGPHGLVAGTTGSGKSEILQSYILSMATLFHPYEVGFLIIDFKGGGMVNQFKELPHLLGAITNIDGKEIDRSLKSIKAELQKRQRMFAEADVNHIDKYIRKFKSGEVLHPLPHLIIIVDEFAELKAEQPDFMKELISAARIGRSLGVHLILATQKPSGQVDEQIWSNSRFKLCLKVQTQEDSNEVLKSPLAAEIKEPGRAYLQVGNNEIFELFQSAYSGAPENQDMNTGREFTIYSVNPNGKRIPVFVQKNKKSDVNSGTQLDALVKHVSSHCLSTGVKKLPSICLPPLPEIISYAADSVCVNDSWVPIGIYDDPDSQIQEAACLDIAGKNTIIIGSPQTGKTNMLQSMIRTIAETNTVDEANIYIIDFASMVLKNFEELAHVGGVVTSSEDEKLKNLFKLLHAEIASRKEKLLSVGVSSFSAYKDAGYTDLPQIYLVIDNLTALIELYLQDDDTLLVLIREGLAVGISTIVANAQTAGIGYRYFSNFSNRIALHLNDTNEYGNLFDQSVLQPSEVPGRCVLSIDKKMLECQTYLAFEGEREIDRVKEIHRMIDLVNGRSEGKRARQIPAIPAVLSPDDLVEMFGATANGYTLPVGVTYTEVTPFFIDLSQIGAFGVCGQGTKSQGNFIKNILISLQDGSAEFPVEVQIFDDVKRTFADMKEFSIVRNYTLDPGSATNIVSQWYEQLENRYQKMLDATEGGKKDPLLVMVIQNNDVAKIIGDDYEAMNQYSEITSRFKSMGVCIIFANFENASLSYDAPEPLRQIKQDQHLIFFGDLDTLKPFDPPYEAIRANKKKLTAGDAYYIRGNDVTKLKMVEPAE